MNLKLFGIMLFCSFGVMGLGVFTTYFGHARDSFLSEKAIQKLALPKKSFLRKLLIFREPETKAVPFLYIEVIPFLILTFIIIGLFVVFFLDQYVICFVPEQVFYEIIKYTAILYFGYQAILTVLIESIGI